VRFYYDINSTTQFAFKFNPGIAYPFGPYSQQVPYVKQFFVGGPSSNRAWQIRELGPGRYRDPNAENVGGIAYYQTGDIKLDMSAEIRFPLFWYFKGALFIDAANVWTIAVDPSRDKETHFQFNRFLNELGIGYGFGVRLDLDYFIIRLDLGYKWISPYVLPDTGTRVYKRTFPKDGVAQIAVGQSF
jgi:outer membrane protein assembly factor BamA